MRLFLLGLLSALLFGCANEYDKAVAETRDMLAALGEVLDFKKLNGEKIEGMGPKRYIVYYRAAIRTKVLLYRDGLYLSPLQGAGNRIAPGTLLAMEGSRTFKLTDNGWQSERMSFSQLSSCVEALKRQTAQECYAEAGIRD